MPAGNENQEKSMSKTCFDCGALKTTYKGRRADGSINTPTYQCMDNRAFVRVCKGMLIPKDDTCHRRIK